MAPSVYFVVLNWNQPEMTSDCLRSLAQQDYPSFHVVVVDNGSTDGSVKLLRERFPWTTLLEIPDNVGYSPGNNVGIEYAMGQGADYVFLLNNDTEVDPQMLGQLVEIAESDPEIGLVGPTMYYADPPDVVWGAENRIDWRCGRMTRVGMGRHLEELGYRQPVLVDYVDTCSVLVKHAVLDEIGAMDGRYFINFDDLDLNVRARKAGFEIFYVPRAHMWHKVSATMGVASPATTYYMTRNALLFFWSHSPGIWRVLSCAQILLRTCRTVLAWSLKQAYRTELFQRKRDANLFALRDFFCARFGRMGPDVAQACYGKRA
jgi:GT2 family glycosyltransferase